MNKKVITGYIETFFVNRYLALSDDVYISLNTSPGLIVYIRSTGYSQEFKTLYDALQCPQLLSCLLDYPNQPHEFKLPPELRERLFNEELDKELDNG